MVGRATILHADLDAFYASVEQLLDPSLRGRPIAVGGGPHGGVVLAASYEAKVFRRQRRDAGLAGPAAVPRICVRARALPRYQRAGRRVMDILGDFTPAVERISIDEAFLDVSGVDPSLRAAGRDRDRLLRRRVRAEVGLPISVGAARTKHLAKVASQVAKPDGLVVVEPDAEREFLDPLPVGLMWGVGPVAQRRLAERGITTIGELAPHAALLAREAARAAPSGARLSALAVNEDPRRIVDLAAGPLGRRAVRDRPAPRRRPSWSARCSATSPTASPGGCGPSSVPAARSPSGSASPGMRSVTRSLTLPAPLAATLTLTEIAEQLAWTAIRRPGRRRRDQPAGDLDLEPRAPAGAAVRAAAAAGRPAPGRARRRGRRAGPWTSRWTPSAAGSAGTRWATGRPCSARAACPTSSASSPSTISDRLDHF